MRISAITGDSPSPEKQLILGLSSMFEGEFTLDWIEELTGMKASFILSALEEEAQNGLLNRIRPAVYSFKKNRRKSWLDKFTEVERKQFHRDIASVLIQELSDDDAVIVEIAQHLLQIPDSPEECQWLMRAGKIYARQLKTDKASICFKHILKNLTSQNGKIEDLIFIKAAISLSNEYGGRKQINTIQSFLCDAKKRAKRQNQSTYILLLEMHIAKYERLNSEFNSSFKHFQNALKKAKEINDPKINNSLTTLNISFLCWQGQYNEVVEIYEKTVPEIPKLPIGYFSILVSILVGHAYTMIGQITQGLGMLDALYTYCLENENYFLAAHASSSIAITMLEINNTEDALRYMEQSYQEASCSDNAWVKGLISLMLAVFYHKNDQETALSYIQKYLKIRDQVQGNLLLMPYLLQVGWLIQQGQLPEIEGISFKNEVSRMLSIDNCYIRGLGYRYEALAGIKNGWTNKKITRSLASSSHWLKKAGHKIEFAKTNFETARYYLTQGKTRKARILAGMVSRTLSSLETDLIPDDLRPFISDHNSEGDILTEIFKISRYIAGDFNNKKLLQQIITTVNRLTGAERGAFLLVEKAEGDTHLHLRAAKNFTVEQFLDAEFDSSRKMIEAVIESRQGCITEKKSSPSENVTSNEVIRSSICVPLVFMNRAIGALYHDNSLLSNIFKESDLKLLDFFASLAAIGLDSESANERVKTLNSQLNEDRFFNHREYPQSVHIDGLIGESPAFKSILSQIEQVAKTDTAVLLTGETGVGKNLIAQIIHNYSLRSKGNFITVQCSALTESLITSELFGHEKGAFTGAINQQIGRFEMADGGTLFLDEIGDLPLEVQVRLLRVLQSKEFERVGGAKKVITSNFRLITATNSNLQQNVKDKQFREDLYYRINIFPIHVPPLRERKEDIPLLIHQFLELHNKQSGKSYHKIPKKIMAELIHHSWPGNIRELENVIQRGVIISQEPYFQFPLLKGHEQINSQSNPFSSLIENERQHIQKALHRTGGKIHGPSGAAELLQINPSTLTSRLRKLKIKKNQGELNI